MILVTGGTGFIGRALVRQLVESGYRVRTLLRPSPRTPRLPIGVPVEIAVSSLDDTRGLRSAMRGVDAVYHLIGDEGRGWRADLRRVDVQGTKNLADAAADAGIRRFFYVSHLGADRASAFPVMKAKGIAEEHIRQSGVPYTILRASLIFGPEDNFTTNLARLIRVTPFVLPLPNHGKALLQPLWVEDLVACLLWSLEDPATANQVYEIGGGEFFSLRQIVEIILEKMGKKRILVSVPMPWMRAATVVLEHLLPRYPLSTFWLDYLAVDRVCEVSTLPQVFNLMPSRFSQRIDYLAQKSWIARLFSR
jgi:NADH dehydrogenase